MVVVGVVGVGVVSVGAGVVVVVVVVVVGGGEVPFGQPCVVGFRRQATVPTVVGGEVAVGVVCVGVTAEAREPPVPAVAG